MVSLWGGGVESGRPGAVGTHLAPHRAEPSVRARQLGANAIWNSRSHAAASLWKLTFPQGAPTAVMVTPVAPLGAGAPARQP
jgi:hypothetical protein